MNSIREQLDQEKQTYRDARYPGDLASDVLPRRSSSWWIGALGAVAAMIVVAIDLWPQHRAPAVPHNDVSLALSTRQSPPDVSLWSPPSVPAMSSDIGGAPSLGPMPSFPDSSEATP